MNNSVHINSTAISDFSLFETQKRIYLQTLFELKVYFQLNI